MVSQQNDTSFKHNWGCIIPLSIIVIGAIATTGLEFIFQMAIIAVSILAFQIGTGFLAAKFHSKR